VSGIARLICVIFRARSVKGSLDDVWRHALIENVKVVELPSGKRCGFHLVLVVSLSRMLSKSALT